MYAELSSRQQLFNASSHWSVHNYLSCTEDYTFHLQGIIYTEEIEITLWCNKEEVRASNADQAVPKSFHAYWSWTNTSLHISLKTSTHVTTFIMIISLDDILMSDDEKDELADKTGDTWSNNVKSSAVLWMKVRDTAVSSVLCKVMKYNQPVLLSTDFDSEDDSYVNTTAFQYIFSEKPSRIHHLHNEEAKSHRMADDKVLYRIDMIENGQLNLLFMNIKDDYMKFTAVDTEGKDMRKVILKVTRTFYSEAYTRLHVFKLHSSLYKMWAPLFIQWHLSDFTTSASVRKYLYFTAHRKIVVTFNRGKCSINWVRNMNDILDAIDDQINMTQTIHQELKEYLLYWRYITTEKVKVTEEVTDDEIKQISRLLFNSTVSHDELWAWRAAASTTSALWNQVWQTLNSDARNEYKLSACEILKLTTALGQLRVNVMNLSAATSVYKKIWEEYW